MTRQLEWQRKFLSQMKQIWLQVLVERSGIVVVEASLDDDLYNATDMLFLAVKPSVRLACRVRSFETYENFPGDFTLRTYGKVTELQKILSGLGDYYLYAFADESEEKLISWFIGDLEVFRRTFKHTIRVKALGLQQRCIEWHQIYPAKGTPFAAFKLSTFPPEFIVASHNNNFIPRASSIGGKR